MNAWTAPRLVTLAVLLLIAVPVSGCRGEQRDSQLAEPRPPAAAPPLVTQGRAREVAAVFAHAPVRSSDMSQTLIWGWPAVEFIEPSTGHLFTVDLIRGTVAAGTYLSRGATVSPDVGADPVAIAERFARDNGLVIPAAMPESDLISGASQLYRVSWSEEASGVVLPRTLVIHVLPSKREVVRFLSVYHDLPATLVPQVNERDAAALATSSVDYDAKVERAELAVLPIDRLPRLMWRVFLTGGKPVGNGGARLAMATAVYVDASSGALLHPFGD